jgi:hypothetical protein
MTSSSLLHRTTSQLRRTAVRATSVVAAAGVATALAVTPASASVLTNGARGTALAGSSQITHQFSVLPSTSLPTGVKKQTVTYRIALLDMTTAGQAWHTYGWASNTTLSDAGGFNSCDVTGCEWITVTGSQLNLPVSTFTGTPGHRYQVDVQYAYYYSSGWVLSAWGQTEFCDSKYQVQGITFTSHGSLCFT